MSPQKRSSHKIKNKITLTLSCAKKIAMRQNNEMGDLVCDFFITMEKAVRLNIELINMRNPQKPINKKINSEVAAMYLNKYGCRSDNGYMFSSNADMVNMICFGKKAKEINALLDKKNDGKTRDRLILDCIERLTFLLNQHLLLLKIKMDFDQREQMLLQLYKVQYGNQLNPYTGELSEIDYVRPSWWDKKYLV